jgi:hypothetical protein
VESFPLELATPAGSKEKVLPAEDYTEDEDDYVEGDDEEWDEGEESGAEGSEEEGEGAPGQAGAAELAPPAVSLVGGAG